MNKERHQLQVWLVLSSDLPLRESQRGGSLEGGVVLRKRRQGLLAEVCVPLPF